ncbi:hypothetical protein BDR06DRAFT_426059 [Suillus hirtellus]|nr:hypothetical protein BDR06DRAFT_426059 [Suillus hirtellus]
MLLLVIPSAYLLTPGYSKSPSTIESSIFCVYPEKMSNSGCKNRIPLGKSAVRSVVNVFMKSGQPYVLLHLTDEGCGRHLIHTVYGETTYHSTRSYVSSLPSSSPESQSTAIDAITLGLHLHTLSDFDSLFKLHAVVSAKDHHPFSLLQVFFE